MTSARKGLRDGGLKIYPVFVDSIVFGQNSYCSFLQMEEVVGLKIGPFFGPHTCINP